MITAASNPKVKNLTALMQKSRERRRQDVFPVEGPKLFLEADRETVKEVYLSYSLYERLFGNEAAQKEEANGSLLRQKLGQTGYEVLEDSVFGRVSDTRTPQGIICVIRQVHYRIEEMLKKENPCLLLLEDIQDPGNLGTMLRTAEAAGMTGVIMSRGTVDIYNPKTIRSTMGSIYRLPFCYTEDLSETIRCLKEGGVEIFSAHLQAAKSCYEMDFTGAVAFLIGNEGNGLRPETAAAADQPLIIPMHGKVESLNAAAAASVLMYEAARQRWVLEGRKE